MLGLLKSHFSSKSGQKIEITCFSGNVDKYKNTTTTRAPTEHRAKNTLRAREEHPEDIARVQNCPDSRILISNFGLFLFQEQSQNINSKFLKMLKKHKPAFSSLASVTLFSKSTNAFMLSETILKILESWSGDHWRGLDMLCHFGQIVI